MNTISTQQLAATPATPATARQALTRAGESPLGSVFLRKLWGLLAPGRRWWTEPKRSYPTRMHCAGYVDRRTPALAEAGRVIEQERADRSIEEIWRARVRLNWKERARVLQVPRAWLSPTNPKPAMLSRQAD